MPTPVRARADACPGVFAPHDAADGALARIRLPGGVVTAAQLRVLAACARDLGDGAVHLTSRGNLQLRGLDRDDPALAERLGATGLLPAPSHERVRNILASPLSGYRGGLADVRGLTRALDRDLCARPALAGLPGRFLFALDDGRGDVAAEGPDLCWRALDRGVGTLLVAGYDTGLRVPAGEAVDALLRAAEAFLALREADGVPAWRVHELDDAPARIAAALRGPHTDTDTDTDDRLRDDRPPAGPAAPSASAAGPGPAAVGPHLPIGPVTQDDGGRAVGVAPVLGELTAAQVRLLADLAPAAVVTPWRTILLPDLPDPTPDALHRLREAGLVVNPGAAALGVSACAGRPGCAKALADVRADTRAALEAGLPVRGRAHVVGCARRCGAPNGPHTDVVAEADGYRVDGTWVPVGRLAAALRGTT
ncbi:precorrin-3B synthase [Pseudonocardia bannensis]|uniref:Precorrin-3B synthase n=1 Tax=Pseudonocardia bannensis TaxID=630973 RepID=A0A848DMV7_9PSEU|nr:precorrin-3B synthase [Pseudonocardia bannensis]NMH93885.1 precorrin-3B synthase [Pseudonocardia bannensis]